VGLVGLIKTVYQGVSLAMAPFDRQYMTFYWSATVSIALLYTIFKLFDVE